MLHDLRSPLEHLVVSLLDSATRGTKKRTRQNVGGAWEAGANLHNFRRLLRIKEPQVAVLRFAMCFNTLEHVSVSEDIPKSPGNLGAHLAT